MKAFELNSIVNDLSVIVITNWYFLDDDDFLDYSIKITYDFDDFLYWMKVAAGLITNYYINNDNNLINCEIVIANYFNNFPNWNYDFVAARIINN